MSGDRLRSANEAGISTGGGSIQRVICMIITSHISLYLPLDSDTLSECIFRSCSRSVNSLV
jgi:hypothetical protein